VRSGGREAAPAVAAVEPAALKVRLQVLPSEAPWRSVTAAWIPNAQLPLLRRLAYALPHGTVAGARIALTAVGAFLRADAGVEAIPLGTLFAEARPGLYVLAGHAVAPAVAPDVLAEAFGLSPSRVLFIGRDARAVAIEESAFVPLELALLEAPPWEEGAVLDAVAGSLEEPAIDLRTTAIGLVPLRGVEPPVEG
jgi:hypothetical protein